MLDHLTGEAQSRIYATAAVLQYLLRTINPTSSWGHRLKQLFAAFPTSDVSTVNQAGFPAGWEQLPLWQ